MWEVLTEILAGPAVTVPSTVPWLSKNSCLPIVLLSSDVFAIVLFTIAIEKKNTGPHFSRALGLQIYFSLLHPDLFFLFPSSTITSPIEPSDLRSPRPVSSFACHSSYTIQSFLPSHQLHILSFFSSPGKKSFSPCFSTRPKLSVALPSRLSRVRILSR